MAYDSSGTYRDAFLFSGPIKPDIVLKRLRNREKYKLHHKDLTKIHREAIVLERLSHSPRILDIYAHCGTSILVEAMAGDIWDKIVPGNGDTTQEELDKLDDVYPLNNFTASEKLQISLEMALSLADLHNFEGGVIHHGDTHLEQWLLAPDKSLKLNDFNNALIPTFDVEKGDYCTQRGSYYGVVSERLSHLYFFVKH